MGQSKRGKLDGKIQILQWCTSDPGFRPDILDGTFKQCEDLLFTHTKQNSKRRRLVKTDPLRGLYHHYQLKTSEEFRYLQLRNY